MVFKNLELKGLTLCIPKTIKDKRGYFSEIFRKDLLENHLNQRLNFCQQNISESKYGTIRGLHFQKYPFAQNKLISVISGEILDVVLDLRKESSSFGKYYSIILDDKNKHQLFIPKGFAHGFSVLSKKATIQYFVDNYYDQKSESGINPLDPYLDIEWRIKKNKVLLSKKDNSQPVFNNSIFVKF